MYCKILNCVLLAALIQYSHGINCNDYVGATYQIITDVGPFSVYQFVRLQQDGSVTSVNNVENGFSLDPNVEAQPFTAAFGEWKCIGKYQMHIRTADFNHKIPNNESPTSISWDNIIMNFTANSDNVRGAYRFAFYPVGSYPLDATAQPLPDSTFGPYPFTGRRFRFFSP